MPMQTAAPKKFITTSSAMKPTGWSTSDNACEPAAKRSDMIEIKKGFNGPTFRSLIAYLQGGTEAFDAMGVFSGFKGILCPDHWKPYYKLDCTHALFNAHHLRELTRAWEQDEQHWPRDMKDLLETINSKVIDAGGALNAQQADNYRSQYRELIKKGEMECPKPTRPNKKGKRGRIKKSKSRNLLERLKDYENDVLRFMENEQVSFTTEVSHFLLAACGGSTSGA